MLRGPRLLLHGQRPALAAAAAAAQPGRASRAGNRPRRRRHRRAGARLRARSCRCCSRSSTTTVVETTVLFLESSDESLVRRFSETRRRHPLDAQGRHQPARGHRRGAPPARRPARRRRHDLRHQRVVDPRDPPPGLGALRRGRARAPAVGGLGQQLRLQARHSLRHRSAVRRALPREPALRARAARAHRPRRARGAVPRVGAGVQRGGGAARGAPPLPAAALPRREAQLPVGGGRLHRRPAPLGRRLRTAGAPPRLGGLGGPRRPSRPGHNRPSTRERSREAPEESA